MRSDKVPGVRLAAATAAALGAVLLLAGCVGGTAEPTEAPTMTQTETPEAPATVEPLVLDPAGSAADNLEYFTSVVDDFLASAPDSQGREIVDHLASVGFDKSQMELTADTTAVGLEAENIKFSVKINDSCLIGQSGNVGTHTIAAPILATGTCLVGDTRAIDW
jgi:hypothetical protein